VKRLEIIVCVKQVPGGSAVKMIRETLTVRDGSDAAINPFDYYAVEEAVRIKEMLGGKVTVISMGAPRVAEMLKETIALGADSTVLLSDDAFAGSDALATARTLATGIRKIGPFDLVICGKQAIDGDTAQVGPSLAEKLGIPHTTFVRKIEAIGDGFVRCQRMTEDGYEVVELALPALLTVVKEINEPRLPSLKGLMRAKKEVVQVWSADDIGAEKSQCGLAGSPTRIVQLQAPERDSKGEMIEGEPAEQARKLVDKLLAMQLKLSD
jgi:electron transfer flavoprotein beta subunit